MSNKIRDIFEWEAARASASADYFVPPARYRIIGTKFITIESRENLPTGSILELVESTLLALSLFKINEDTKRYMHWSALRPYYE